MLRRSAVSLSNWREHGISYLKYLNVCTDALHASVKESRQAKYQKYSIPGYVAQKPDGQGTFVKVDTVPSEISQY
jgi:hypothetical protein